MGLFKCLPKVNRCCLCTRSLKCASFMIIVIGMFTGINSVGFLCTPVCKELYEVSSPVKVELNILRWFLFSSEMLLLASIFGFLLGIFYSIRITADILICTVILKCLLSVIYAVIMIIQEQYSNCHWYYSQIFHLVLFVIIDTCCFCFSVKTGSILIVLCTLMTVYHLLSMKYIPLHSAAQTSEWGSSLAVSGTAMQVTNALMIFFGFIFMFGAVQEKYFILGTLFLITIAIYIGISVFRLIMILITVYYGYLNPEIIIYHVLPAPFLILLWIYFMIVVRTQRDEMI